MTSLIMTTTSMTKANCQNHDGEGNDDNNNDDADNTNSSKIVKEMAMTTPAIVGKTCFYYNLQQTSFDPTA